MCILFFFVKNKTTLSYSSDFCCLIFLQKIRRKSCGFLTKMYHFHRNNVRLVKKKNEKDQQVTYIQQVETCKKYKISIGLKYRCIEFPSIFYTNCCFFLINTHATVWTFFLKFRNTEVNHRCMFEVIYCAILNVLNRSKLV